MFKIYLAGSMAGRRTEEVQAERAKAIALFAKQQIFAVDPAASEQKLLDQKKSKKISLTYSEDLMEAFVWHDKWLIRHCDALIVLTGDNPSDGTWREMCYAEIIGLPVVLVAPRRVKKDLVGWSNICVPDVVSSIEEAALLVKKKFAVDYEMHKKYFEVAVKDAKDITKAQMKYKKRKVKEIHSLRLA